MALEYNGQRIGAMQYNGVTIGEAMIDGQIVYRSVIRVTPVAPTFHDGEPWITLPTVEGVTYSVSGTPGYNASVTVTATAQPGYELVGTASWSHTYGPEPLPVVQITGTVIYLARDQFRQACIDFGTTYQTVTELPFLLDTSQATWLAHMFRDCTALVTVPPLDTSNVTRMEYMFENCQSLTHVPDLDAAAAENCRYMFRHCHQLTDGNVRLIGRHPNVATNSMIDNSGLTREPFYDQQGNPI